MLPPALDDDQEDSLIAEQGELPLSKLPPMPPPNYNERCSESILGIAVVTVLVGLFVGVTHGVAVGPNVNSTNWVALLFIYAEAAIAFICLAGILFGDPGVVKRSRETCYPIPPEVAERLQRNESLSSMSNIEVDGKVYCVRCLVWRPRSAQSRFEGVHSTHHCSTCQRCVVDFDHHCGVFGRCIAGKGLSGNMKYFTTIITMAVLGMVTCLVPTLMSVAEKSERGGG